MPRKLRMIAPGEYYHITQRGNYKQPVFQTFDDYSIYCEWITLYAKKYRVSILAYCLMPNHVHFIVTSKEHHSISNLFMVAHMRYSQHKNRLLSITGHLWHGRFFSAWLDQKHIFAAIRYVENNPVRADIVSSPEDYIWSSTLAHLGRQNYQCIELAKDINVLDIDSSPESWQEYLRKGLPVNA